MPQDFPVSFPSTHWLILELFNILLTIKTNSKSFDYRTGLYKIVNEIVDDRYIYKQESGASIIFSTRKNVRLVFF